MAHAAGTAISTPRSVEPPAITTEFHRKRM